MYSTQKLEHVYSLRRQDCIFDSQNFKPLIKKTWLQHIWFLDLCFFIFLTQRLQFSQSPDYVRYSYFCCINDKAAYFQTFLLTETGSIDIQIFKEVKKRFSIKTQLLWGKINMIPICILIISVLNILIYNCIHFTILIRSHYYLSILVILRPLEKLASTSVVWLVA